MRHSVAGNRLSRKTSHRKATVRDVAKSTLFRQRIYTTKAKAQEGRKLVDQLITLGKKGTLAEKRRAFAILCDHNLVSSLFNDIAPRFKERKGGYSRIIKMDQRRGDNAEMVYLELTEKGEALVKKDKLAEAGKAKKITAKAKKVDTSKEADVIDVEVKEVKKEKSKKGIQSNKDFSANKKEPGMLKKLFHRKTV